MSHYSDKELRAIVAEERRGCEHGSTYGECAECYTACPDLARDLLAARRAMRDARRIVTYWLEHPERGFLRANAVDGYAASLAKIDRALGSRAAKKGARRG